MAMCIHKKGIVGVGAIGALVFILFAGTLIVTPDVPGIPAPQVTSPVAIEYLNGTPMYFRAQLQEDEFTSVYLQQQSLEGLQYELARADQKVDIQLKAGNGYDGLRGIQMGDQRFAVDLIACNHEKQSCVFRVNGVATRALYVHSAIERPNAALINPRYVLKMNAATFDYCDERRFCDYHFQAYDVVDVSIIPTNMLVSG